jgi:hypothetical protein
MRMFENRVPREIFGSVPPIGGSGIDGGKVGL